MEFRWTLWGSIACHEEIQLEESYLHHQVKV
jgi:hypothetical protein